MGGGPTWCHQSNSFIHSQSTSISLRSHFEFTSVSHRFHFDFTSISLCPPLKLSQNIGKTETSGTTGTGGPAAQRKPAKSLNPSKNKGKHINTHQDSSRNHQGSSTISQNHFSFDFAKQRPAPNQPREGHGRTDPRTPGPRTPNHRINPSDRITHPGTIKISRFDSPPSLRLSRLLRKPT